MSQKLIKPAKLNPGDLVATSSISSGIASIFPWRYQAGKEELIRKFGVRVVETPHSQKSPAELHDNPKWRADDLMWAFKNPEIKAIIANIGGEDCIRLLPYIDLNVIRDNPKIVMGYSDTTSFHLMCYQAGLSTIYGPSIMAGFAENQGIFPYMEQAVKRTLFSSDIIGEVKANKDGWTEQMLPWNIPGNQKIRRTLNKSTGYEILQGKKPATGHLLGGCMEVLDMCNGTPIWPTKQQWKGAILFLETSEEQPQPGMLRNLLQSMAAQGILQNLAGIIMGRPKEFTPEKLHQYDETLTRILREHGCDNMPVMTQMDFGHTDPAGCLPYGARATVDPVQKTFTILENACVNERHIARKKGLEKPTRDRVKN